MKAIAISILSLVVMAAANVAHAEDSALIRQLQSDLKFVGYDIGEPDGVMGKKTKDAIADYKKKMGLSQGASIATVLVSVQIASRDVYEINKSDKEAVVNDLDRRLKDPYSAHYYWSNGWTKKNGGGTWVCGMVNAKNSYGGYVGKTPFMALLYNRKDGERGASVILYDNKASERLFVYSGCSAP